MKDNEYTFLSELPKELKDKKNYCALEGKEARFPGLGLFKNDEKFTVIQNRKGHKHPLLTYVLMHNASNVMIRVDLKGRAHNGLETPHVHIYDQAHKNGSLAIPLADLKNYSPTDNIVDSVYEFLKYNNFTTDGTIFSIPIV